MGRRWLGPAIRTMSVISLVVVLAAAGFLAWRIPRERAEERVLYENTRLDDGPYVTWSDGGRVRVGQVRFDTTARTFSWSEQTLPCRDAAALANSIDPSALVECPSATSVPLPAEVRAPAVAVISDIHGHYDHLVALLQANGIVDSRLDWSFGLNHLVVNGDIVDKGPEIVRCLWLVKKLEHQAIGRGGRVHVLLGNHEYLAMSGKSRINDLKYIRMLGSLGIPYESLFSRSSELGRWLRRQRVVVRVNDTLFVHGGVSAPILSAGASLDDINRLAVDSLRAESEARPPNGGSATVSLVWSSEGPASYRGYFDRSFPLGFIRTARGDLRARAGASDLITATLAHYGCRRIVVGHTEARHVETLFGGRVIAICQRWRENAERDGAGAEMLVIEDSRIHRLNRFGERLPFSTEEDH